MNAEETQVGMALIWTYGLTRAEAVAYVLCSVRGMSKTKAAELLSKSRSVVSRQVKAAEAKINGKAQE